jgi:Zn-dependent M28 family amino/carboxypeptidase
VKAGVVLGAFVSIGLCAAAQQRTFDGKTLWSHVEILAADDMEGRAPGSTGLNRAEAYVVNQLKKIGLTPAGVNGYYQPVKLLRRTVAESDSNAALLRDGKPEPLVLGEDAFFPNDVDHTHQVEAPLVFLGYGLQIPERHYDDFAGLDLKGKIAVTVPGRPEEIAEGLAVQYSATSRRWKQFRDAGLVGWVEIAAPEASWSFLRDAITSTTMYLARDEVNDANRQQMRMVFNPAHADKLFEGSGHTAQDVFALGKAYKRLPRFPLRVSLRATTRMLKESVDSANLVAKLEGSDPRLRNEYVVLSAHIDHLGVREPVNGDRIYNGAVDNASGVAALLDIADALKREAVRPRRSVLFTFFTAEEEGKLGSEYFTAYPTVDHRSMVADLNIDGIQAIVPLKAMQVLGAEESTLGETARRVAASYQVGMDTDVDYQFSRFANSSDQRSFAFAGIPALKLNVGFPGELNAVQQRWRRERYHTPFDDPQQPINLETIAAYEEIARALLLDVANEPRRPQWNSSSFYRRYAR